MSQPAESDVPALTKLITVVIRQQKRKHSAVPINLALIGGFESKEEIDVLDFYLGMFLIANGSATHLNKNQTRQSLVYSQVCARYVYV